MKRPEVGFLEGSKKFCSLSTRYVSDIQIAISDPPIFDILAAILSPPHNRKIRGQGPPTRFDLVVPPGTPN